MAMIVNFILEHKGEILYNITFDEKIDILHESDSKGIAYKSLFKQMNGESAGMCTLTIKLKDKIDVR
jgi:hypothetical protein